MRKRLRMAVALSVFAFLLGCPTVPHYSDSLTGRMNVERALEKHPGLPDICATRFADLALALGEPDEMTSEGDRTSWVYRWEKVVAIIPLAFGRSIELTRQHRFVVEFDDAGIVRGVTREPPLQRRHRANKPVD